MHGLILTSGMWSKGAMVEISQVFDCHHETANIFQAMVINIVLLEPKRSDSFRDLLLRDTCLPANDYQ